MTFNMLYTHGSRNYFLLIDEFSEKIDFDRGEFTKKISKILKIDGTLFVQKSNLDDCLGKMAMYNTDGSEAEMCGNGIRIVARKIYERFEKNNFQIETKKGKIDIKKMDNIFLDILTFSANINPVNLILKDIPMRCDKESLINETCKKSGFLEPFSAISVQNPHIVFIKDEIDNNELEKYGKQANNNNEVFPNGINVNFVQVLDKNKVFVKTYERGVGITNSCGTGMSSSSYIVSQLGICEFKSKIEVMNNGGKVYCIANSDTKSIDLIGNATYEKEYEVLYNKDNLEVKLVKVFDDEIESYQNFIDSL